MARLAPLGGDGFLVGESCTAARTPVNNAAPAVNELLLVQAYEHLAHRPRQAVVHSEPLAFPVTRASQALQLFQNRAPVALFPGPHACEELLASQLVAVESFLGKTAFNHILRRDAGMIGAREPQAVLAAHPVVANQDVLQSVVQHVPHSQAAGNIRGRDDDREARPRRGFVGVEIAPLAP